MAVQEGKYGGNLGTSMEGSDIGSEIDAEMLYV